MGRTTSLQIHKHKEQEFPTMRPMRWWWCDSGVVVGNTIFLRNYCLSIYGPTDGWTLPHIELHLTTHISGHQLTLVDGLSMLSRFSSRRHTSALHWRSSGRRCRIFFGWCGQNSYRLFTGAQGQSVLGFNVFPRPSAYQFICSLVNFWETAYVVISSRRFWVALALNIWIWKYCRDLGWGRIFFRVQLDCVYITQLLFAALSEINCYLCQCLMLHFGFSFVFPRALRDAQGNSYYLSGKSMIVIFMTVGTTFPIKTLLRCVHASL